EVVDAVFTNAAMHWMTDPPAVIKQAYAHLKPGGRFVGEFGGHGNIASVFTALRAVSIQWGLGPDCLPNWFFPTVDHFQDLLEEGGFVVPEITIFPRITYVPAGMKAWLQLMTAKTLGKLPINERPQFLSDVAALLKPALQTENGEWHIDYVRIQFMAIVPDEN
ncbi:MAG: methyltransferase domain-containing protein, partial [Pseudomonadota bacterium]